MRRQFYRQGEFEPTEVRPNLFGAVLEGEGITIIRWEVKPGSPRTSHHVHDAHEQFGVVLKGTLETTVGDEVVVLHAGDMYWAPTGVPHGSSIVVGDEEVVLLDIFCPPREEYVAAAHGGIPAEVKVVPGA